MLQSERAAAILSSGRLDGSAIVWPLKKALEELVPAKSIYVRGAMKKSLTSMQVKAMSRGQLWKAYTEKSEYDDESQAAIESEASAKFSSDSEGVGGAASEELEMNPPGVGVDEADMPGSVAVRAGHDVIKSAVDLFAFEMSKVEHAELKSKVLPEIDKMIESLSVIAEAHDSTYSQAPSIASGAIDDEVEVFKSMLVSNPRRSASVSHIARVFNEISKSLSTGRFDAVRVAKSLSESSEFLKKMVGESASCSVVPIAEHQKVVDEVEKWKGVARKADAALRVIDSRPERV